MSEHLRRIVAPEPGDVWFFAYGSLMWDPGFAHVEVQAATLEGRHRAFCIYSHHHRGTSERPGLVLGLDAGGRCRANAFRFRPADRRQVVDYLDERELIGYAYRPAVLGIDLEDGRHVAAYTFVADPTHPQYAGRLPLDEAAALIMQAAGRSGLNRDYLVNTVRHLETLGLVEPELHALLEYVARATGELDQGAGI